MPPCSVRLVAVASRFSRDIIVDNLWEGPPKTLKVRETAGKLASISIYIVLAASFTLSMLYFLTTATLAVNQYSDVSSVDRSDERPEASSLLQDGQSETLSTLSCSMLLPYPVEPQGFSLNLIDKHIQIHGIYREEIVSLGGLIALTNKDGPLARPSEGEKCPVNPKDTTARCSKHSPGCNTILSLPAGLSARRFGDDVGGEDMGGGASDRVNNTQAEYQCWGRFDVVNQDGSRLNNKYRHAFQISDDDFASYCDRLKEEGLISEQEKRVCLEAVTTKTFRDFVEPLYGFGPELIVTKQMEMDGTLGESSYTLISTGWDDASEGKRIFTSKHDYPSAPPVPPFFVQVQLPTAMQGYCSERTGCHWDIILPQITAGRQFPPGTYKDCVQNMTKIFTMENADVKCKNQTSSWGDHADISIQSVDKFGLAGEYYHSTPSDDGGGLPPECTISFPGTPLEWHPFLNFGISDANMFGRSLHTDITFDGVSRAFIRADSNGDDYLSTVEFDAAFISGSSVIPDSDNDGRLNFTEWANFLGFARADTNRDGSVSEQEYTTAKSNGFLPHICVGNNYNCMISADDSNDDIYTKIEFTSGYREFTSGYRMFFGQEEKDMFRFRSEEIILLDINLDRYLSKTEVHVLNMDEFYFWSFDSDNDNKISQVELSAAGRRGKNFPFREKLRQYGLTKFRIRPPFNEISIKKSLETAGEMPLTGEQICSFYQKRPPYVCTYTQNITTRNTVLSAISLSSSLSTFLQGIVLVVITLILPKLFPSTQDHDPDPDLEISDLEGYDAEEESDIQLEMMSGPQGPQMQMIQDMSETIETLSKFSSNFTKNI